MAVEVNWASPKKRLTKSSSGISLLKEDNHTDWSGYMLKEILTAYLSDLQQIINRGDGREESSFLLSNIGGFVASQKNKKLSDAFLSRLKGNPAPDSNFVFETFFLPLLFL